MPLSEQQWSGLLNESPEIQGQVLAKHKINLTPAQLQTLKMETQDIQRQVYAKHNLPATKPDLASSMTAKQPTEVPGEGAVVPEVALARKVNAALGQGMSGAARLTSGIGKTLLVDPETDRVADQYKNDPKLKALPEQPAILKKLGDDKATNQWISGGFDKFKATVDDFAMGLGSQAPENQPDGIAEQLALGFISFIPQAPIYNVVGGPVSAMTKDALGYVASKFGPQVAQKMGQYIPAVLQKAGKYLGEKTTAGIEAGAGAVPTEFAAGASPKEAAGTGAEFAGYTAAFGILGDALHPGKPTVVPAGSLKAGDAFAHNGKQFQVKAVSPMGTVSAAAADGSVAHLPKFQTVTAQPKTEMAPKTAVPVVPVKAPVSAAPPEGSTKPAGAVEPVKQAAAQPLPEVAKEVAKPVADEAFPGAGISHENIFKLNPRSPEFRDMVKQHPEIAEYRMTHDPLTRLLNRADYFSRLESDIKEKGSTDAGQIDFDKFKPVNDIFGHGAGDDVLKTFGKAVVDLGLKDHIFRIGGEEFGVRGFESPAAREQQMGKLSEYLSNTHIETIDGTTGEKISWQGLPFSQGHATIKSLQEFNTNVDKSLYQDKQSRGKQGFRPGGNRLSEGIHLGPEAERLYRQRIGQGEALGHDEGGNSRPGPVQGGDRENPQERPAIAVSELSVPQLPGASQEVAPSTTDLDPKAVLVVRTPVSEIHLSEDVPNFKTEADEKTGIVPSEQIQAGEYEELATGPIVLWRRKGGRLEVITGRHRLDLARRTGKTDIPSQIVNEADGFTKEMARVLDAEANIRDGQGSTGDFADYFRNSAVTSEDAKAKGLLSRAKGKASYDIGRNASEDTYTLFRNDKITEAQALAITRAAPSNEKAQSIGNKYALDGKTPDFVANMVKVAIHNSGGESGTIDLFGRDDSALKAMEAQATRASAFQRELRDQVAAVQGAARRPEEARRLGVDVKDPEGILKKVSDLKAEAARWDNWPQHSDLVAKTRGEQPAPDFTLSPEQPKASIPPALPQPGLDLGLKGDALRAPDQGGGTVDANETELAEAAKEAVDREKQEPLFSKKQTEKGTALFSRQREEYKLASAAQDIQRTVKTLTGRIPTLKGKVEVVKAETDLPDHLKSETKSRGFEGTVEGVFDPKTGKIYVVSDNIFGKNRVEEVLRHELSHSGIRNVLGDRIKPVFQQIYKQFENTKEMSKVIIDYDLNTDREGGRLTAVDEFIARHGEQYQKQPVVQRMISMIRHELRKMGFKIKWSDKDIINLAGAALKSEGAGGGEIRFSFAGKSAKGFDQAQGKFSDLADRKERFEISDEGAKWEDFYKHVNSEEPMKLSDVLDHAELYKQYPELRDANVKFNQSAISENSGSYSESTNTITLSTGKFTGSDKTGSEISKEMSKTLIHEIQHAIQEKEGFAKGGRADLISIPNIPELKSDPKLEDFVKRMDELSFDGVGWDDPQMQEIRDERDEYTKNKLVDAYGEDYGMNIYRRLAGEEEARRVSARTDMTAEERMGTPYEKSDLAPGEERIVRQGGGVAESRERDNIQGMTPKEGAGEIPTGKPESKPEGGNIQSIKREQNNIIDDLKKLFNENIEHWTWFNNDNDPIWLIRFKPAEIPSSIKGQVDNLYNAYLAIRNSRNEILTRYVSKRSLNDFSLSDIKQTISYSDMNIATGWRNKRDENGPSEYAIRDNNEEIIIKHFESRKDAESYAEEKQLQFINPVGLERIFFRVGKLPENGRSYNHMTNRQENGVSVYVTPSAGSFAGLDRSDWYYGKGKQIDTGGDDEPVIVPTGKWKKFNIDKINPSSDPSRSPQSGDQAAPSRPALEEPKYSLKPSNLNPFQREQVKTPEFRAWFKDSKVVDENGEPATLYHGTAADFEKFSKSKLGSVTEASDAKVGFWFSDSPERASMAAEDAQAVSETDSGANIRPVYLKMENPYEVHVTASELLDPAATAKIIRQAKRDGHDGIIMTGVERGTNYVVFKPEQIKSATANTGEFSAENPDIRFSRRANNRQRGTDGKWYVHDGKGWKQE